MSSNTTTSDSPTSTSVNTATSSSDESLDSSQSGSQVQGAVAKASDVHTVAQSNSSVGDTETSSGDESSDSLQSGIQVEGAAADTNVQTVALTSSTSATKVTSTTDTSSTSATAKTTSTSDSGSTSANSSSTSTLGTAKTTATSATSTSGSTSQSSTSSVTSASTSTTTAASTQAESAQGGATSQAFIVSTAVDGQVTTITTNVPFTGTSASANPTQSPQSLSAAESFLKNKPAVGAVFGVGGLVVLIALLAIILKIVRYRANRKFERELDEKVAEEVRAGTPMSFGFGKEDDGLSIIGGRAGGLSDPERAYGGGAYTNQTGFGIGYGAANTSAYATYGGAAAQPAFYSPNSSNSTPRRYPSDPTQYTQYNNGGNGLQRTESHTSTRSYGTLNQAPMNAFAPNSNAPGANGPFAPATFTANYGEYRHASPAPSTQSWQSQTPYGARPGTPSALTPGGRGPTPGPAPPRGVYAPLGARSDSPAVLGRYSPSHSPQNSKDGQGVYAAEAYVTDFRGQSPRAQAQGGLAAPARGPEPPSPNVSLPNPFDQRDH